MTPTSTEPGPRSKTRRLARELTLRLMYAVDTGSLTIEQAWERCSPALLFEEDLPRPDTPIAIEANLPRALKAAPASDAEGWTQAVDLAGQLAGDQPPPALGDDLASRAARMARDWLEGWQGRREDIDAALGKASKRWKLSRMAAVDRNILRLGAFEILGGITPPRDAIFDGVELAKKYGDVNSPRFVNGILDQLCREQKVDL